MSTNDTLRGLLREMQVFMSHPYLRRRHPDFLARIDAALAEPVSGGDMPQYRREPLDMSKADRDRLTLIAREAAISSPDRYSYMPTQPETAQFWMPHDWVLDAMRMAEQAALNGGAVADPYDHRTESCPECQKHASKAEPKCSACQDSGIIGHSELCPYCKQGGEDNSQVLKPCPFCGGNAEEETQPGNLGCTPSVYRVGCVNGCCDFAHQTEKWEAGKGTYSIFQQARKIVWDKWNARATPAPIPDAAEGVEVKRYRLGGDGLCNMMNCSAEMEESDGGKWVKFEDCLRIVSALRDGGGVERWVPVSERLPEEHKADYLCLFEDGRQQVTDWLYDETEGWCFWYGDPTLAATASAPTLQTGNNHFAGGGGGMSKPAYAEAWAVCRDDWLMIESVSALRTEAINKFMSMAEGPNWSDKQWRHWKRRGYRASHVSIHEYLFGKGDTK